MQLKAIFAVILSILFFSSPVIAGSDAEADQAVIATFMESDVVK